MQKKVDLILVPTDFSELSCQAFPWATFLAEQLNAKILLVHIIAEPLALKMVEKPGNPWELVLEREDKAMIEKFSQSLKTEIQQGVEVETYVGVGPTAETLINVAQKTKTDVIIMATHGRRGIQHALMGSVTEKVLQRADCPVFTVRPEEF